MPPRALSRLVCAAMTATPSRAARSASRPDSESSESRSSGSKISGWWLTTTPRAEAAGLVEHGVVHLERDEDDRRHVGRARAAARQLVAGRADLQPHVVPRLRQLEGRQTVDRGDDVTYLHVADTTPVAAGHSVRRLARRSAAVRLRIHSPHDGQDGHTTHPGRRRGGGRRPRPGCRRAAPSTPG